MSFYQTFFQTNRRIATTIGRYLPQESPEVFSYYDEMVVKYMSFKDYPSFLRILDVGGGAQCRFSRLKPSGSRIICVDISPEQLAHNQEADERLEADVTQGIPLPDASVDLVISRALMEHLADPGAFMRHAFRVLKPGGYCIHLFPCKFAPFALIKALFALNMGI